MPDVVTCLLMDEKENILILKRSNKVKTYKGLWSGVAGYIEEDEQPLDTAFKEISEEVSLSKDDVRLIKKADNISFTDVYEGERYDWVVHPFLFKVFDKSKIDIDWEHTRYEWISPPDIKKYDTVPHLKDVVLKLLG